MTVLLRFEWPAMLLMFLMLWVMLPPKIAEFRRYLANRQNQPPSQA